MTKRASRREIKAVKAETVTVPLLFVVREVIYRVLRDVKTKTAFPNVVAGQLSASDTWIMDCRPCRCHSLSPPVRP